MQHRRRPPGALGLSHAQTVWNALDRWRRFFILLHRGALGAISSNVQCGEARRRT